MLGDNRAGGRVKEAKYHLPGRDWNNAMPFVPVLNVVQVNLRGTYFGEQVENTLYFETAPAVTPSFVANVALSAENWWVGDVVPLLSSSYVWREAYAVDLTTATGPTATSALSAGTAGGAVQPGMPGNVALCISFRTDQRGRSFRGRNYLCGLTEDNVVGNQITPGSIPPFVNAYLPLLEAGEMLPGVWVVVSRFSGGLRRTVGVSTPVTSVLVVDNNVDSMRRRLAGRGR